jgi:uncharacterized coiled-coil protein SlyX
MTLDRTQERFLALETKLAYQEKLLAELHEVLLERGQEIDALKRQMANLERVYREGPGPDPTHEAPPHY